MLNLPFNVKVFLYSGHCDMRKGFDGLYCMARNHLNESPSSGHIFVFSNRSRRIVKLLYFDGTGLWVMSKRLEKGCFSWPESNEKKVSLSSEELGLLLGGIDLKKCKKKSWFGR